MIDELEPGTLVACRAGVGQVTELRDRNSMSVGVRLFTMADGDEPTGRVFFFEPRELELVLVR